MNLSMMGNLIQLAKITSIVAGAAITLFLANLLLSHSFRQHFSSLPQYSWITSQLLIFTIFKLSTTRTNNAKSDASDHRSPPPATTVAAAESDPMASPSSTDTIAEGGSGGPARLRKSNTWEGRCRRVAEAEAEAAVSLRRLRRWETFKTKDVNAETEEEEDDAGSRVREEELMAGKDELFQRVETFIKKHYDQLRLQRQQEAGLMAADRLHKSYQQI